jgi:hypothetical protein
VYGASWVTARLDQYQVLLIMATWMKSTRAQGTLRPECGLHTLVQRLDQYGMHRDLCGVRYEGESMAREVGLTWKDPPGQLQLYRHRFRHQIYSKYVNESESDGWK